MRDLTVEGSPWALVQASYLSAKSEPTEWGNYSAMLPEELWDRLQATALFHSRRTLKIRQHVDLGFNHLIDAAFTLLPRDRAGEWINGELAADLGRRWGAEHPVHGDTQSSGSRISKRQRDQMLDLTKQLKGAKPKGLLWQVQAAVIEYFLNALDAEFSAG